MAWTNLSGAERLELGILQTKGYSLRAIARVLGRSPNTLSYELRHNQTRGSYQPKKAQAKARVRKRMRRWQWRKIETNAKLRQYVINGLRQGWNPDEIAGRMRQEKQSWCLSKNSIYRWLYSIHGQRFCPLLYSRRYQRKPRRRKANRTLIPERVDITRRFKGAEHRTRYGHWEKDAIVSGLGNSSSLAVAVERKSRLVVAQKVRNLSPAEHERATQQMLGGKQLLSITRDNGIENSYHRQTTAPSFFCRPYAAWQKGSIENANKLIRRFLPKGTNLRLVSQHSVKQIVELINKKPRKILGYRSALEVAEQAGMIKSIKNGGVLIEDGI